VSTGSDGLLTYWVYVTVTVDVTVVAMVADAVEREAACAQIPKGRRRTSVIAEAMRMPLWGTVVG
jgi:hypothetical protein